LYKEYWKLVKENKPRIFNRSEDIRTKANLVIAAFDKAALLVESGLVDPDEFFRIYHTMFIRFWIIAKEDIDLRSQVDLPYAEFFKKLVTEYIAKITKMPDIYEPAPLEEEKAGDDVQSSKRIDYIC
jgi:hypothetical protein